MEGLTEFLQGDWTVIYAATFAVALIVLIVLSTTDKWDGSRLVAGLALAISAIGCYFGRPGDWVASLAGEFWSFLAWAWGGAEYLADNIEAVLMLGATVFVVIYSIVKVSQWIKGRNAPRSTSAPATKPRLRRRRVDKPVLPRQQAQMGPVPGVNGGNGAS